MSGEITWNTHLEETLSRPAQSDGELVRHARDGRQDAWDELVRRHRRSAYLLALQLLGQPEDAWDVTQEALLRFVRSLARFDARRPVRPWLLKIVRNRALDHLRRRRTRGTEPLSALQHEVADPAADPERDAHRGELRRRLWQAVAQLPMAKREILMLRDYHDLSYAEIADVLGIPQGTVMSRLHHARRQLRQTLLEGPSGRISS